MKPTFNCFYSKTDSSSSIRLILSLLIAFFVFAYIPLGVEGTRQGESCSTLTSHRVECSDPNALCNSSTSSQYGTCQCPEPYHTINLFDNTSHYVKTQCVKVRADENSPCINSIQCQLEDAHYLCTYAAVFWVCECSEIDGFVHNIDGPGCVPEIPPAKPQPSPMWFRVTFYIYSVSMYVVLVVVVFRLCLRVPPIDGPPPPYVESETPTVPRSCISRLFHWQPTPRSSPQAAAPLPPIQEMTETTESTSL